MRLEGLVAETLVDVDPPIDLDVGVRVGLDLGPGGGETGDYGVDLALCRRGDDRGGASFRGLKYVVGERERLVVAAVWGGRSYRGRVQVRAYRWQGRIVSGGRAAFPLGGW